jgi:cytochrome c
MKSKIFILFCCTGIFPLFILVDAQPAKKLKNSPPTVEILTPEDASFDWNSFVRYSIRVTDAEDGSTEYEEISSKEVFLEVTYLTGSLKAAEISAIKAAVIHDPPGLALMKTSTCFNCHSVKAKLVGPSFSDISRKYPYNTTTISTLAKKVIKGSTGVWTNIAMPPNPDFKEEQSKQMIQWIIKNSGDPNINYFVGTEGSFKTRGKPGNGNGSYILRASYTDHGIKGIPNSNLRGEDTRVIESK